MSQWQPGDPDPARGQVPPDPHAEPTEVVHPQAPPSLEKDRAPGGPGGQGEPGGPGGSGAPGAHSVPPVPPPPPPVYGEPTHAAGPGVPQPPSYGQPPFAGPSVPQPPSYGRPPSYGSPQPPGPPVGYGPQPGPAAWPSGQSAAGWPGTAQMTGAAGYGPQGGGSANTKALIIGIVAAVVAVAAVVVSVVLLTGDDDKDPVAHGSATVSARPTVPTGPIPGTSRPPSAAPTATGAETVRKMNRDDCLDETLTADGHLATTAGMVPCDAGNAAVKITSAIKKSSGRTIAECDRTEGATGWDIPEDPDNFYCVEREYRPGQCFPATDTSEQLSLVVDCTPSAAQGAGTRVLRVVQVLESASATCAGDYAPVNLTRRQLTLCTDPVR